MRQSVLPYVRSMRIFLTGLATGNDWRSALALVLSAAAIQTVFLLETAHALIFRYPLVDAATYHYQAVAILAGKGTSGAFWQPPGYPHVLAALEWLCGGASPGAARALQALLLAPLLSLFVWRVGRRLLPTGWAFAAGFITCITGPLLFYASQLLPAAPAAVLVTAAFLLVLRAGERPTVWRWLTAGMVTGLATLMVATAVALVPVMAWFAWRSSKGRRMCVLHVAALVAGVALCVLPVSLRNLARTGHWVWLSTNDGINFYVGNSRNWRVTLSTQPGLDWDKLVRLPYTQGNAQDDIGAARWFRRQTLREMRGDSAGAIARLILKSVAFWHGREIPRNLDLYGWRNESVLLRTTVWHGYTYFPTGLLVPLAVVGVIVLRRRREGVFLIAAMVAFGLLVALFFPCSRYRVPLLPGLVVLAAAGLNTLTSAVCAGRPRTAAFLVIVAVVVGVATNVPLRWPTDVVRYDAHLQNAVGAAADMRRDLVTAKTCYEEAVRLDPQFADAYFNLGTVYERLSDKKRAETCYADALASRYDHDKARINFALLLARRNQLAEALHHLAIAETVSPLNAGAWFNHAAILLQAGRRREALEPLRRAAELDPKYYEPYRLLSSEVR